MQRITMEYPASHLYFLGIHTVVYTKKIQITSDKWDCCYVIAFMLLMLLSKVNAVILYFAAPLNRIQNIHHVIGNHYWGVST